MGMHCLPYNYDRYDYCQIIVCATTTGGYVWHIVLCGPLNVQAYEPKVYKCIIAVRTISQLVRPQSPPRPK
jgi:hypothetical protein